MALSDRDEFELVEFNELVKKEEAELQVDRIEDKLQEDDAEWTNITLANSAKPESETAVVKAEAKQESTTLATAQESNPLATEANAVVVHTTAHKDVLSPSQLLELKLEPLQIDAPNLFNEEIFNHFSSSREQVISQEFKFSDLTAKSGLFKNYKQFIQKDSFDYSEEMMALLGSYAVTDKIKTERFVQYFLMFMYGKAIYDMYCSGNKPSYTWSRKDDKDDDMSKDIKDSPYKTGLGLR